LQQQIVAGVVPVFLAEDHIHADGAGLALVMRSSTAACSARRQGQRPMLSILSSSMATMTTSGEAGRWCSQAEVS
jgi:hypothetical protein